MNIHISVKITIRNMFMSCKLVSKLLVFRNKPKPVDFDKFEGILTCVYVNHVLFRNGHLSYNNNFIDFIFDMKISVPKQSIQ